MCASPSDGRTGGPAWRPGMPTRCGRCASLRIEYDADGSARCLGCGAVTPPAWFPSERLSRPSEAHVEASAAPVPGSRADHPGRFWFASDKTAPGWTASTPYRAWGRLLRLFLVVAIPLILLLLFAGVPWVLSYAPEPIIHMSDYFITVDYGCQLTQHVTLTNDGGRAGLATLTFYVSGNPFANWSVGVGPRSIANEVFGVAVPNCTAQTYGIAITSIGLG